MTRTKNYCFSSQFTCSTPQTRHEYNVHVPVHVPIQEPVDIYLPVEKTAVTRLVDYEVSYLFLASYHQCDSHSPYTSTGKNLQTHPSSLITVGPMWFSLVFRLGLRTSTAIPYECCDTGQLILVMVVLMMKMMSGCDYLGIRLAYLDVLLGQ